ncbi:MAG: phosphatidylglycerophosphatase A [Bacilli bacterium]|jgi:phosphatidylglycerophosphatase A
MKEKAIKQLEERGVTIRDISKIVLEIQKEYQKLTYEECDQAVLKVLNKREVIHTILVGITLDKLAEERKLDKILNEIILEDHGLFGIDEILSLSIINMHGSIALTNFGYLDKTKLGIIGKLDKLSKDKKECHTFLDDIIAALAASAASRLAHSTNDNL